MVKMCYVDLRDFVAKCLYVARQIVVVIVW